MRIRTYLSILVALLVVVAMGYLTHLNIELLRYPFQVTTERSIPFYALLLGVFLLAFLPTATVSLIQSVRGDLAVRRERREARQAESLERALRRAVDLQADQQWQRAAEEWAVVLEQRPEDFEVLLRYGEVQRQQGLLAEAVETHRRGTVVHPQSVALLYQLAEDYDARGETEVAREVRNRILRDFPGMGLNVLRRRRNAALEGRLWNDALTYQERIEALVGKPGATLENAVEIRRGLRYQEGVARMEEERYGEAEVLFLEILETEPRFIPAAIMLGEARLLLERPQTALDTWLEGFERTGSPVFLQRIEDYFIEGADPARAIETLWALIGRVENDTLPRFFLGRLYYRLEMHAEALKVLESVRDRIENSPTFHYLLARIHHQAGHLDKALQAYVACAQQLRVTSTEYACRVCHAEYPDWDDRCNRCGSWNSIELNFHEERLDPEALGLREAPVWGGYEEPPETEGPEGS